MKARKYTEEQIITVSEVKWLKSLEEENRRLKSASGRRPSRSLDIRALRPVRKHNLVDVLQKQYRVSERRSCSLINVITSVNRDS